MTKTTDSYKIIKTCPYCHYETIVKPKDYFQDSVKNKKCPKCNKLLVMESK